MSALLVSCGHGADTVAATNCRQPLSKVEVGGAECIDLEAGDVRLNETTAVLCERIWLRPAEGDSRTGLHAERIHAQGWTRRVCYIVTGTAEGGLLARELESREGD